MSEEVKDLRPVRWIVRTAKMKALRQKHALAQVEAAEHAGVSRETWIDWEGSKRARTKGRIPDERIFDEAIRLFCQAIGEDPQQILSEVPQAATSPGFESPPPLSIRTSQPGVGRRDFPILGQAGAAAHPILTSSNPEDWMDFSDKLTDRHRFQCVLKVLGDSAEEEMSHGDWILVTKDETFRLPGFFCVICNAEHEYLVKVSHRKDGELEFHAPNPEYKPVTLGDGWEMFGFVVGWKQENGPGEYIEAGHRDGLRTGFRRRR